MGLQNKGCRHWCPTKELPKKHFSGELKKGGKDHTNGITSWLSTGRTNTTAGRVVGRDHSVYSIPATHSKLTGKSRHSFLVSAEKDTSDCESCGDVYCNILPKMLCRTLRRAVFWIELHKNELLEVKVTIYFYKQRSTMCKLQWMCSDYKFRNSGLKISNFSARL
jgi:hypothetical protein